MRYILIQSHYIWDKIFKNGPSEIFLRLPSTNFTWSILEYFVPSEGIPSTFWKKVRNNWLTYCLKNTAILPNFLMWKFCEMVQFTQSFGRFDRNFAETVPFHIISIPGSYGILRSYTFSVCISDAAYLFKINNENTMWILFKANNKDIKMIITLFHK